MKRIIFTLITLSFTIHSHAWTSSHKKLLQELEKLTPLVKKLPASYKSKLYNEYSLYPDNNFSISASLVGDDAVNYLKSKQIYYASALHKAEALPYMFHLLVEALRARDYNKVIVWIGSISHNLNDSASPEYLPSYYAVNQMAKSFNLKLENGKYLNAADKPIQFLETLFSRQEGMAELKKLRADYKFELKTKDAQELFEYLATLPIYLRNASFTHSQYLMDNYQRNIFTDKKDFHNGNVAIARMGTVGIKATADVLNTAYEFASKRIKYREDKIDYAPIEEKINKLIKKRELAQLPLYKDLLPANDLGKIGILTEGFYQMEESALGYSSRYLAASIMGTLKKANQTYRVLDIKQYLDKAIPSPKQMPILVVPACELTSGFRFVKKRDINKRLNDYASAGGRILLITSIRASFMGDLSFNLKTLKDDTIFEGEIMEEAKVHYNDLLGIDGSENLVNEVVCKTMSFKTIPTKFGWINVKSQLTIDSSDEVVPLAFVQLEEEIYPVAGYLKRKDNPKKADFIAFSNMVFYPYLMSKILLGITEPSLDPVPEKLLLRSIEMLK